MAHRKNIYINMEAISNELVLFKITAIHAHYQLVGRYRISVW